MSTERDDYYRRAQEEYYFCQWVAERKPGADAHTLWLQERDAYLAQQPHWVKSWQRSKAIQRDLRHTA